jgi:hypothetical protein
MHKVNRKVMINCLESTQLTNRKMCSDMLIVNLSSNKVVIGLIPWIFDRILL